MFRTIFWYLVILIAFIISIPFMILSLLFCHGKNKQFLAQKQLDFWLPTIRKVAGMELEISGKENIVDGPALYVSNHQGLFDIIVGLSIFGRIVPFLAKIEASKIPMVHAWMKVMDCIFIDRGNARASLKSLKECEDHLKQGKSLLIFPEGTRSRKHEMNEFKAGALRCAIKANVPIVPIALDGTYKLWEEKHRICPAKVTVKVLAPVIPTNGKSKTISQEIEEEIRKALG